jgi:transcriptional regulator with XRE-family HTH domain
VTLLKYGFGLPIATRIIRTRAIPKDIIPPPVTLGQHLKQRRDKLKLRQRDVADILGVGQFTYMTWEKDQSEPRPRYYPAIIDWLGYEPFSKPDTEGEALRQARLRRGLTAQEEADAIGIDEQTLLRFENGSSVAPTTRQRLISFASKSP